MSAQNTSDLIEAYLRKLLENAEAREIEIQRAEIASHFDVVPSQINYVIKTRFTPLQGYDVESKRGGGGYIRIVKYHYSAKHDFLNKLYQQLPLKLTAARVRELVQVLFDEGLLKEHEGNLLLSLLTDEILSDGQRSQLLVKLLQRLDREDDI